MYIDNVLCLVFLQLCMLWYCRKGDKRRTKGLMYRGLLRVCCKLYTHNVPWTWFEIVGQFLLWTGECKGMKVFRRTLFIGIMNSSLSVIDYILFVSCSLGIHLYLVCNCNCISSIIDIHPLFVLFCHVFICFVSVMYWLWVRHGISMFTLP